MALQKLHVSIPTNRVEGKELEEDLKCMGCLRLFKESWRVQCEAMVRELVTGQMVEVYASTIRGQPDRWNAELWIKVDGFKQRGEGMDPKKDDCTQDKFSRKQDPKYGYYVGDYKYSKEKRVLAFLVPILSPKKPYNVTLTLANTLFLSFFGERLVDWGHIIEDLVHRLATNTKHGQPSYIGPFLFHLYDHRNLLTAKEKT